MDEYEGDKKEIDPTELMRVIRCILAQTKELKDWRRINVLQTFVKLGERVCKIIIDNENCVNAIFTSAIKNFGLTIILHPNPYKVS